MLQKIGIVLLTLGSVLFGYSFIHFGMVSDVKDLPLLKRWLFWLRGGRGFWDSQRQQTEMMLEKGIRPKLHWRTERTPRIIAFVLMLIGLILCL